MGFLKFRQFILGFFLAMALLFAFEAGEKGVEHNRHLPPQVHQKPFKSFPLFNGQAPSQVPGAIQTQNTQGQVKTTDESKKEEEKKEEEKKASPTSGVATPQQKVNSSQESELGSTTLPLGAARVDSFGVVYSDQAIDREAGGRKKTLPEISELYVPVYSDQNLSLAVVSDFSAQFPQDTLQGKLYILGSEMPASNGETRYQILVYENQGFQFKGAFETTASSQFPFQGIPTFEPRHPAQFQESSRLLVFASSQADLHQLLSQEAHVQAILKSAYHPSLDPQTFVGRDSQWNVDIYHIFPGIFLAEPLR